MPLRQNVLAIPTSLVIYEMDFSKQNAIKNHLWASLKLDTLDALMKVSLYNIRMDNMDWNAIFWGVGNVNIKNFRILTLE
jgi:hypothetical protein